MIATIKERILDMLGSTALYWVVKKRQECKKYVTDKVERILDDLAVITYLASIENKTVMMEAIAAECKKELTNVIYYIGDEIIRYDKDEDVARRLVGLCYREQEVDDFDVVYRKVHPCFVMTESLKADGKIDADKVRAAAVATMKNMDRVKELIVNNNLQEIKEYVNKL